MKPLPRLCLKVFLGLCVVAASGGVTPLLAQNVQVTSATPSAAAQGTINLNVVIGGNGFKKGAAAQWFVTGTTNPGGVTVNSTAFNSSSQLTANITISDTAIITGYDVVVYSSGRTGKGTGLFSVTQKGTPTGCTTLGTPSGFTLVTTLNYLNASGAPQYQPHLGTALSVRPVTLTNGSQSRTVQVAAVGAGASNGRLEFFFLDPDTGEVLDGTAIVGTQVQPHITVQYDSTTTIGAREMWGGDVNADGIPDFVLSSAPNDAAFAFVGSMDANGIVSWRSISLPPPPSNPGQFGRGVAMGKLDASSAGDEVVVTALGTGGKKGAPGAVYIYRFDGSGFDLIATVADPLQTIGDGFGTSSAIGDVTGDGVPDLIVGAGPRVYVFPSPLTSTTNFVLTTSSGGGIGDKVGAGMLSSATATDVMAVSPYAANPRVLVFSGPITGNRSASTFDFLPDAVLTGGWATGADFADMSGDGRLDILIGAPNAANSNSCNDSVGAAQLFVSNPSNPSQATLAVFQPPTVDPTFGGFGFGVALVPSLPGGASLLLVGENGRDLGGVTGAGQIYVYKKN